jgi:hypothetical protein
VLKILRKRRRKPWRVHREAGATIIEYRPRTVLDITIDNALELNPGTTTNSITCAVTADKIEKWS